MSFLYSKLPLALNHSTGINLDGAVEKALDEIWQSYHAGISENNTESPLDPELYRKPTGLDLNDHRYEILRDSELETVPKHSWATEDSGYLSALHLDQNFVPDKNPTDDEDLYTGQDAYLQDWVPKLETSAPDNLMGEPIVLSALQRERERIVESKRAFTDADTSEPKLDFGKSLFSSNEPTVVDSTPKAMSCSTPLQGVAKPELRSILEVSIKVEPSPDVKKSCLDSSEPPSTPACELSGSPNATGTEESEDSGEPFDTSSVVQQELSSFRKNLIRTAIFHLLKHLDGISTCHDDTNDAGQLNLGDSSGSQDSETPSSTTNNGHSNGLKRSRGNDENDGDGNGMGPPSVKHRKIGRLPASKRVACPYYKRNPSTCKNRSCGGPGWKDVNDLK
jgi:hypothetical protein